MKKFKLNALTVMLISMSYTPMNNAFANYPGEGETAYDVIATTSGYIQGSVYGLINPAADDGSTMVFLHITDNGYAENVSLLGQYSELYVNGENAHLSNARVENNASIRVGGYTSLYYPGGLVTGSTAANGGSIVTIDGGIAKGSTLEDGGLLLGMVGGIDNLTTVNNGGRLVTSGGTSNNAVINSGGIHVIESRLHNSTGVRSDGISNDATINSGGVQNVTDRGTANGTTIYSGGTQNINAGGEANHTKIAGGTQNIVGGDVINTTMTSKQSKQYVEQGGTSEGTIIYGGTQSISTGSIARSTTLEGGLQIVRAGSATWNTTINSGQSWLETGALADGATEINSQGELLMDAGAHATNVQINGGTLSVTDLDDETTSQVPAQVDKLSMNGGNVSFLRDSEGDFAALNIAELSGTGNFLFNSSLAERNSNFVTIEQGAGKFGIAVTDSGKEIVDHTDLTVNLIHDQGGDIDFDLVSAKGRSTRAVDGGTYMYTLYSGQDKDGLNGGNVWYLGAMTEEDNGGGDGDNNGNTGDNGDGKPLTTPATDAILSMSSAGLKVIGSELDGLRMYRANLDKTGPESNVWGHYLGSKNHIDTSNGAAYTLNQNGMEIGADTRTDFGRGSLVTGAFMSYSDNQVKHARGGKSKIDSYGLGVYATWFDTSGFYADGVIKGNRLNNKLSAVMTNGGKTSGDWNQYALSTAIEGGYQFDVTDELSLTPYARLTFTQLTSEDVKLSNGMKGNTGTPRSVTGEAGTKVAGKFTLGDTVFKPYLSAAVVQEFADSNDVTINSINRFDNNTKGTSGKYGVGASVNLSKDITLYGEANYRQGSHVETPVQGVAGIRFGF